MTLRKLAPSILAHSLALRRRDVPVTPPANTPPAPPPAQPKDPSAAILESLSQARAAFQAEIARIGAESAAALEKLRTTNKGDYEALANRVSAAEQSRSAATTGAPPERKAPKVHEIVDPWTGNLRRSHFHPDEIRQDEFWFSRAIAGVCDRDWTHATLERDMMDTARKDEGLKRTMQTAVNSAGGFLVPSQAFSEIIPILRARTIMDKVGVRMLTGLTGWPVTIPKQTGSVTGGWIGEGKPITGGDATFDVLSLMPRILAGVITMTRMAAEWTNPSIEAVLRDDLVRTLQLLLDLAFLKGAGTSLEPRGVFNTSGVQTITATAVNVPWWMSILGLLEDANANPQSLSVIAHPATLRRIQQMHVANYSGQGIADNPGYVMNPLTSREILSRELGVNFQSTTQLVGTSGSAELVAGDFSQWFVAQWGSMLLEATDTGGSNFINHTRQVKAVSLWDFGPRQELFFAKQTNLVTTT